MRNTVTVTTAAAAISLASPLASATVTVTESPVQDQMVPITCPATDNKFTLLDSEAVAHTDATATLNTVSSRGSLTTLQTSDDQAVVCVARPVTVVDQAANVTVAAPDFVNSYKLHWSQREEAAPRVYHRGAPIMELQVHCGLTGNAGIEYYADFKNIPAGFGFFTWQGSLLSAEDVLRIAKVRRNQLRQDKQMKKKVSCMTVKSLRRHQRRAVSEMTAADEDEDEDDACPW
jgi:hypothetical protein